jgi:hypothetical protein
MLKLPCLFGGLICMILAVYFLFRQEYVPAIAEAILSIVFWILGLWVFPWDFGGPQK